MGLHYCITCNEFVSRIKPEDIEPATRGSYLGSWRVRDQMAACNEWPKTELPPDFFEPFQVDTPTVVVSGSNDSASPPNTGEEAKKFLTNAIHVVVPGAGHTPETACLRSIRHELFRTGSTKNIDVTCNTRLKPEPFQLPPREKE